MTRFHFMSLLAFSTAVLLIAGQTGIAAAQLAANQTNGFGNGRIVTFTYQQNFHCVDQPTMDLDFNRLKAQSDPNEMQTPICQTVTEPTADPAGGIRARPLAGLRCNAGAVRGRDGRRRAPAGAGDRRVRADRRLAGARDAVARIDRAAHAEPGRRR